MKKLLCLILVLLCAVTLTACCRHTWNEATCETPKTCAECGETEGEPLGHTWQEAACETPKTCSACGLTEGEALGHTWQEATTEAPKTCAACAATEGERIITDPRFTTASTKDLYGTWVTELSFPGELLNMDGFTTPLVMKISMILRNDSSLEMLGEVMDAENYLAAMKDYLVGYMYAEMASSGMDQAAADEAFISIYNMTIPEYVDANFTMDYLYTVADSVNLTGVYYVADGQFYTGITWEENMAGQAFTLDADTITLDGDFFGLTEEDTVFTRVSP